MPGILKGDAVKYTRMSMCIKIGDVMGSIEQEPDYERRKRIHEEVKKELEKRKKLFGTEGKK